MTHARALPAGKVGLGALVTIVGFASSLVGFSKAADSATLLDGGSGARYRFTQAERCFMRKINHARARHGRRRLDRDKQLGYVARRHASSMASRRGVWHDGDLSSKVTRWRRLGQNVGSGGKCGHLFRSFMRSSTHRHNILGRWRFVGVGTRWSGGRLFVQQVFEHRRNPGNVYHWP